jgi:hypothetical protein
MGLRSFTTAKNKVSICSITRPLTISSGKPTGADRACTNANILPVVKLCLQPRLGSVTDATTSVRKPFMISRSRRPRSDAKTTGTRWTTLTPRRLFKQFFDLRASYPVLNDGFSLVQHGNWTHEDFLPFSNGSVTERGLWSVSRSGFSTQNFTFNDTVWFVYTNENTTITHSGDCTTSTGIRGPYRSDTAVRNLLYPFESYTLGASNQAFFFDDKEPYFGCIESITMQPYDFKVLVPTDVWEAPAPALTKATPGHDARIEVTDDTSNPTASTSRSSSRI